MTDYEIRNRYTGAVQFTAEIDCQESADEAAKKGLAARWAVENRANLRGADLRGARNIPPIIAAQTSITPAGQLVGWKKCRGNVIIKLSIPSESRRSNATDRKCRAEFADCIEVIGADFGVSTHDVKTEYRVGERITCDKWCEDRWQECAGGIHFFITREEAENY